MILGTRVTSFLDVPIIKLERTISANAGYVKQG